MLTVFCFVHNNVVRTRTTYLFERIVQTKKLTLKDYFFFFFLVAFFLVTFFTVFFAVFFAAFFFAAILIHHPFYFIFFSVSYLKLSCFYFLNFSFDLCFQKYFYKFFTKIFLYLNYTTSIFLCKSFFKNKNNFYKNKKKSRTFAIFFIFSLNLFYES